MQLNSVDLPLPFGPMMPRISPSLTSNDTPSTAWMPPKRLLQIAHFEDGAHAALRLACGDAAAARAPQALVDEAEHAARLSTSSTITKIA